MTGGTPVLLIIIDNPLGRTAVSAFLCLRIKSLNLGAANVVNVNNAKCD